MEEEKEQTVEQCGDCKDVPEATEEKALHAQQVSSDSEEGESKPIVVTGFGPIFSKANFSETIMKDFYSKHKGKFNHDSEEIDIVTGPRPTPPDGTPTAIETSYDYVKGEEFDHWLRHSDARLYVHLGIRTSDNNILYFEKQANNLPINQQTRKPRWEPDQEGNWNEGKKCEEDGDDILETSFDIQALIEQVESALSMNPAVQSSSLDNIHLCKSCDAGDFLCDFLYYRSLYYAKTERNSANVLLIHVPRRATEEVTSSVIVSVLDQVIHCLLDMVTSFNKGKTVCGQSRQIIANGGCERTGILVNGTLGYDNNHDILGTSSESEQSQQIAQNGWADDDNRPIVVTGFGPILKDEKDPNISATIVQAFYDGLQGGKFRYNDSEGIPVLTGTASMMKDTKKLVPIETSYSYVTKPDFENWLKNSNARLYVHLGTTPKESTDANPIYFQSMAYNGDDKTHWGDADYGPPFTYDGKCVTCGPPSLNTSVDLRELILKVEEKISGGHIPGAKSLRFNISSERVYFLCNFLYYRSLYYHLNRSTKVIFIHVPADLSLGMTASNVASVLREVIASLLDECCGGKVTDSRQLHSITNQPLGGREGAVVPSPCPQKHLRVTTPSDNSPKIVITGFGPTFCNWPNLSWKVVQKFRSFHSNGVFEHKSVRYQIETGPKGGPIETTYDYMTSSDFDEWLRESNARLYVHLGIDPDLDSARGNVVRFDKLAIRGDSNDHWVVDRNKCQFQGQCIINGPSNLRTTFRDEDLSGITSSLPSEVKREKINGSFSFEQSTKADLSLCNFLYYRSLDYAEQRNKENSEQTKSYVVFIHIPMKLKSADNTPCSDIAGVPPLALVIDVIINNLLDKIPDA